MKSSAATISGFARQSGRRLISLSFPPGIRPGCVRDNSVRFLLCACVAIQGGLVDADEPIYRVNIKQSETTQKTIDGRIVVEAADGGIMVQSRDGQLHSVTPKVEISREKLDGQFKFFTQEEAAKALAAEFGAAFQIRTTPDYVICSNAGEAYTKWCGLLFQRLAAAFRRQWKNADLQLHDSEVPLTAIVFRTKQQFAEFASKDASPELAQAHGYYSIRSNRMVLYDLTNDGSPPAQNEREIARRLAAKPNNAATIVHEATHQIAFNSGMHVRYADNPLWLTEGMAMYFETPDLRNSKGWNSAGRINLNRLKRFKQYVASRREPRSLESLLENNDRFQQADSVIDAYAESWALNYFLIKKHREQYTAYLKVLQAKPRLIWNTKEERLSEFSTAMGKSIAELEAEFLRYTKRLRR